MRDLREGVLGEFDASDAVLAAAGRLRAEGFREIVTFTPYWVAGLDRQLRVGRTRLPLITLCAGISGAVFAYWLQWYTAVVSYPLNAGARPAHAVLAFVLITFETTVLFACGAGFFAVFFLLRMPRLWHPTGAIDGFERSTVDRFWVGVSRDDPRFEADRVARVLESQQPLRVVRLETSV